MKKHLRFILYLVAIVVAALLILDLRKGKASVSGYDKAPALKWVTTKEFVGIRLLDIFLGVLGLAFVGTAAAYVTTLVKGRGVQEAGPAEATPGEQVVSVEKAPPKKLVLEKALGRTGSKILSAVVITLLVLVVVAMLVLLLVVLFPDKLHFLRDLFLSTRF
jgi:hypothetical protein